jgi:peptidoglycan/LPS O-acetylase OafA/YrhL
MIRHATPNNLIRGGDGDNRVRPLFAAIAVILYGAVVVALFGDPALNHIPESSLIKLAFVTVGFCLLLLVAQWLDRQGSKQVAEVRTRRARSPSKRRRG